MVRSKAGTEKKSSDGLNYSNQNTILINMMWYYFIIYGNVVIK